MKSLGVFYLVMTVALVATTTIRDGMDQAKENPPMESNMIPGPGVLPEIDDDFEGLLAELERAAAIGHQTKPAGSQTAQPDIPPFAAAIGHQTKPAGRPFFPRPPPTHMAAAPPPLHVDDDLCEPIKHLILMAARSMTACPARPPVTCHPSQFSKCTCTNPAKYSDEGYGNCNFGASKMDSRVWCYVEPKNGDPRLVCPDAVASNSQQGWFWSRMACLT